MNDDMLISIRSFSGTDAREINSEFLITRYPTRKHSDIINTMIRFRALTIIHSTCLFKIKFPNSCLSSGPPGFPQGAKTVSKVPKSKQWACQVTTFGSRNELKGAGGRGCRPWYILAAYWWEPLILINKGCKLSQRAPAQLTRKRRTRWGCGLIKA